MQKPDFSGANLEVLIVYGLFALGYTAYYFIFHNKAITDRFHRRMSPVAAEVGRNLLYRGVMIVGFGVIPAVVLAAFDVRTLAEYGLSLKWDWRHAGVIAGLMVLLISLIAINPGKKKLIAMYPQMRITTWKPWHIAVHAISWAAYLLAYELMFRGFMLRAMLPYGIVAAVTVNVAIYVAVHVPKGISEAIGAIPFGLLVCYLTLQYGSIWAAFFLHLALALANSFVALSENPDMRLAWRSTARSA